MVIAHSVCLHGFSFVLEYRGAVIEVAPYVDMCEVLDFLAVALPRGDPRLAALMRRAAQRTRLAYPSLLPESAQSLLVAQALAAQAAPSGDGEPAEGVGGGRGGGSAAVAAATTTAMASSTAEEQAAAGAAAEAEAPKAKKSKQEKQAEREAAAAAAKARAEALL
jgi:hypothetical protein